MHTLKRGSISLGEKQEKEIHSSIFLFPSVIYVDQSEHTIKISGLGEH